MKKLLTILLKFFLFFLPWQTVLILQEYYIKGIKDEYSSFGLYGTEILFWIIVILFIVWFWRERRLENGGIQEFKFSKDRIFLIFSGLFIFYSFLSIFWSINKDIAWSHSLRIMEGFIFFIILFLSWEEEYTKWFIWGTCPPALLGIYQFITQSVFSSKWLGISPHPAWQAGTSIIQNFDERWLRAYGTFNHPNMLGGFLAISLLLFFWHQNIFSKYSKYILAVVLSSALFFTFSRSAWLVFILSIVFSYFISQKNKRFLFKESIFSFIISTLCFISLSVVFFPLLNSRITNESISEKRSISERISGYSQAYSMIKQHPVLGVGAGNYVQELFLLDNSKNGWDYQPVHSVFLLFIAEYGVIGLVLLMLVVVSFLNYQLSIGVQKVNIFYSFLAVVAIIPALFFDHYLLSTFSGLLLFMFYLFFSYQSSTHKFHS